MATGYRLEGGGVGFRLSVRRSFIFSPRRPDQFWGPVSDWGSFPGVKQPGREADHSALSSAEVDRYIQSPMPLHGVVIN
jgi:hypothetical protein